MEMNYDSDQKPNSSPSLGSDSQVPFSCYRGNMCRKMCDYCRDLYNQRSWWSKLLAVVVIVCYFVAVVAIHDQPYLWLALTFAVILCLTTLACSRDDPIIAFRRGGPSPHPSVSAERRDAPLEIWVTDVPPTYSFVMGNSTPPPSYGSALLKFPSVAAAAEKLEKTEGLTNTTSTPMLRSVLDPNRFRSVSRQVSEIGRLSRQVSESGIGRLSRQSSVNPSEVEDYPEDWESGIIIIIPPRLRRTVSQSSEAFCKNEDSDQPGRDDESRQQSFDAAAPVEGIPHVESTPEESPSAHQVFTCTDAGGSNRTVIVVQVTDYDSNQVHDNLSVTDSYEGSFTTPAKPEGPGT